MEIARLCAQLDSVQSMLPQPPSPIVQPSGADFVHAATASRVAQALTPDECADLERIARCNPPRRAKSTKILKDVDHSDTEELVDGDSGKVYSVPRITNSTEFLAYDGSHVLVNVPDGESLWVPYMFLRYGCRSLTQKSKFEKRLAGLLPIPTPPSYAALTRMAINELRQVRFLHYYPRKDLVLYAIDNAKGLAPVGQLADTHPLRDFIHTQKERIEAEGGDKRGVIKRLGLGLKHDDATPQLDADEEYAFMFGTPSKKKSAQRSTRKRARSEEEEEAVSILMMLMRDARAAAAAGS
jgi:hypothetical protein